MTTTMQHRLEIFAMKIVEGYSQSDALRAAHPGCLKWTLGAVHTTASQMMKIPQVQVRVQQLQQERQERHKITVDGIINNLERFANSNIKGLYDDKGNMIPIHALPDDVARTISSIRMDECGNVVDVKMKDSIKPNELLGKHYGMFKDKVDHTHHGLPEQKKPDLLEVAKNLAFVFALADKKRKEEQQLLEINPES